MRAIETVATVEIPEGVDGTLEGRIVTIKGEKGELVRDFSHAPIKIQLDGKTVTVQASWPRKKEARVGLAKRKPPLWELSVLTFRT